MVALVASALDSQSQKFFVAVFHLLDMWLAK